ncbi:uncharacterized protein LOC129750770 isoform X2 [Uranotaenia lowii]|uniref:uncharacterized protein LOC129750770 isoform X2 n=1 Tax=Uranotaenia lowii TaxID=190385 RepID=UPI00247A636C|nr:uncharacterized protein LOC129750770 isoform X2 [Uranotaenia lowii]
MSPPPNNEEVPLGNLNRRPGTTDDQSDGGGVNDFTQKYDVNSFTGLLAILAVNLQQIYMLSRVGSELGPMFYVLISLSSISAIFVVFLLALRGVMDSDRMKVRNRTRKNWWPYLYYTNLILNVLVLVLNLALQIFDQTEQKCQVLLNQPLPINVVEQPK